ncbi:MAG: hypothetical protein HC889_11430 [Synechococcaceae cyanobacterium SM1_2_3]|nr:hypothetical protein [Synechococcaceae cyanobacterium SM1_2_3]
MEPASPEAAKLVADSGKPAGHDETPLADDEDMEDLDADLVEMAWPGMPLFMESRAALQSIRASKSESSSVAAGSDSAADIIPSRLPLHPVAAPVSLAAGSLTRPTTVVVDVARRDVPPSSSIAPITGAEAATRIDKTNLQPSLARLSPEIAPKGNAAFANPAMVLQPPRHLAAIQRIASSDHNPDARVAAADLTKPVAPAATATLTGSTVDSKPLASTRPPVTRSNPSLVKPQDVASLDRGFTAAMADSDTSPLSVKPAEPLILPTTPQVFRDSAHSSSPVTAISPAFPAVAQSADAVASIPDTPLENVSGIVAVTRIADSSVLNTGITATPTAWTSASPSRPEAASVPTLPLPTSQHLDLKQNHWEQNLGRQLNWMVNNQMQEAEIRVNPPDMGPIEVRMSLQQHQTSVAFFCHDASVREAIEKAMPQLREMLNNQGIYLNQAQVSDQSLAQQQSGAGEQSGRRDSGLTNPDSNPGADSAENQPRSRQPLGAVDHYV